VFAFSGIRITSRGGIEGTGPTAADPFILRLLLALAAMYGCGLLSVDLESLPGLRTKDIESMLVRLAGSGRASMAGGGMWIASLESSSQLTEAAGYLIGSGLDYQFAFGDLRFAERDAAACLIAGPPEAVRRAKDAAERAALETGKVLMPLGFEMGG